MHAAPEGETPVRVAREIEGIGSSRCRSSRLAEPRTARTSYPRGIAVLSISTSSRG
ncbi:MAG: hypothetical protein AVDCRST_MAG55-2948 [uncultured Rubrobacteraceae bacterium]|uniref:Uncharacterized protein n=1 Tax=uncultured Rubrobacteraceae bacterium TaxID=349277 RepID=A0A6J4Q5D2_9ACTN|nr:MAG: hypothetical protein AVDCRST_MAG55-2948 [uncultured Rubrobacteraceae bacterium]